MVQFFQMLAYPKRKEIIFDMQAIDFIYPEAVVYLAAIADHLLRRSNATINEEPPSKPEVDAYLDVCGLRKFFHVRGKESRSLDPAFFGDCIPISRDKPEKSAIADKFATLIQDRLALDLTRKTQLSEALGEIMGNALDHSSLYQWYRIGQIHPTRGAITLAIADNGLGVAINEKGMFRIFQRHCHAESSLSTFNRTLQR
ncbi:MAG: ATP-binding protein [Deltaproteobacteria bacterium]|nr:ATP-binding protein [Deltaproteobacteria bacterium]